MLIELAIIVHMCASLSIAFKQMFVSIMFSKSDEQHLWTVFGVPTSVGTPNTVFLLAVVSLKVHLSKDRQTGKILFLDVSLSPRMQTEW